MKIFVTSKSGIVASNAARQLLERGDEVVGFNSDKDYYDVNVKEACLKKF